MRRRQHHDHGPLGCRLRGAVGTPVPPLPRLSAPLVVCRGRPGDDVALGRRVGSLRHGDRAASRSIHAGPGEPRPSCRWRPGEHGARRRPHRAAFPPHSARLGGVSLRPRGAPRYASRCRGGQRWGTVARCRPLDPLRLASGLAVPIAGIVRHCRPDSVVHIPPPVADRDRGVWSMPRRAEPNRPCNGEPRHIIGGLPIF